MEDKNKISPEKYNNILSGLDLLNISLKESNTFINTDIKFVSDMGVSIKDESSFKVSEKGIIEVFQKYDLDARKEKSKSRYIKISVTFQLTLKSRDVFTEDFFDIYKKINLNFNTWPYLREFVNSITTRMNVPPLTLPFYKV